MDSDVPSNNSDEFGNKQPFCDVSEINTPGQLTDPGDRVDTVSHRKDLFVIIFIRMSINTSCTFQMGGS